MPSERNILFENPIRDFNFLEDNLSSSFYFWRTIKNIGGHLRANKGSQETLIKKKANNVILKLKKEFPMPLLLLMRNLPFSKVAHVRKILLESQGLLLERHIVYQNVHNKDTEQYNI